MSNHKYLSANAVHEDEAGYRIEEGTYVEPTDALRLDARSASRHVQQTSYERKVEEARWAALSGPVRLIRPATVTDLGNRLARSSKRTGVAA